MLSAPTRIAPAASRRVTRLASASAGGELAIDLGAGAGGQAPRRRTGSSPRRERPASGPSASPRARWASIASAFASARSAVTSVKAPSLGCAFASMRASVASTMARALARPLDSAASQSCAPSASSGGSWRYRPARARLRRRAGTRQTRRARRSAVSRCSLTTGARAFGVSATPRAAAIASISASASKW